MNSLKRLGRGIVLIWCSVALGEALEEHQVKIEMNVPVPMRDGVKLAADVYRPDAEGRFPAILLRSYYGVDSRALIDQAAFFAQRGYAVALVDSRGRHDSGGEWAPYVNEPRDGYDTQQWLGQQPWYNGKIGGFGLSTGVLSRKKHPNYSG
jgi:hypothetical protein